MALLRPSISATSRCACKCIWWKPPSAIVSYVYSPLPLELSAACAPDGRGSRAQRSHHVNQTGAGLLQFVSERQVYSTNQDAELSNRYNNNPGILSEQQYTNRHNELVLSSKWTTHTSLLKKWRDNPLIDRTELALMALSYNEEWLKNFQPIYEEALRFKTLLRPKKKTKVTREKHQKLITCSTKKHYYKEVTAVRSWQNHPVLSMEAVWFTNYCHKTEKQVDNRQEKMCDPIQLATVFLALRDELPLFFQKGHRYSLYHNKVKFINGLTGVTTNGLMVYKSMMTTMRMASQLYMTDTAIEILKITEDPKECNVKVRWRVSGGPRFGAIMKRTSAEEAKLRYVDGFSIFEVGCDGLIHCHRLQQLMPSKSHQTDNPLWALNSSAVIGMLRNGAPEMLARQRVEDIDVAFSVLQ